MKNLSVYLLLSITTIMSTGCSSHQDVISISEAHYYNENFGVIQNDVADKQVQQELVAMSLPSEVEIPKNMNSEWTMELTKDVDAFYAHEYVEKEEVITYKYEFDKKFYKNAEWRSAQF